jgi:hypothetical protein
MAKAHSPGSISAIVTGRGKVQKTTVHARRPPPDREVNFVFIEG